MILIILDQINGSHKIKINDGADLMRVAEEFGISKKELMANAPLNDLESFAKYVVDKLNEYEESAVFGIAPEQGDPVSPSSSEQPQQTDDEEEDPWVAAKYARGGEQELAALNEKYKHHDLLARVSQKKNKS